MVPDHGTLFLTGETSSIDIYKWFTNLDLP